MTAQPRNPWLILVVFMVAHGVNDGFLWIIPPLLPAIREHFQLSYTEMGISSLSPILVGFASEHITLHRSFFCLAAAGGVAALFISFAEEKPVE